MKKTIINLLGAGILVGTLFVTSCKKDKFDQEDSLAAQAKIAADQAKLNDSLLQAGGIIRYSVLVYEANQTSGKKEQTTGLAGATVTLAQNGSITTVTCDANGIALFPNCRIGNVVVVVKAVDHATLNYKTNLDPGASTGNMSGTTRSVSTILPMFAITGANNTATIKGHAAIETDLTNSSREPAIGVAVSAYINVNKNDNDDFYYTYFANEDYNYTANNHAGEPTSIKFETALSTTTTDVNGNYSLTVPAAVDRLPIQLYFADITSTQSLVAKYLSNENWQPSTPASIKTVRTVFSENGSGYHTYIPTYSPVQATVAAPPAQGTGASVSLKFKAQDVNGVSGSLTVVQTGTLTPGVYSVSISGGDYQDNITVGGTSTPASLSITVGGTGIAGLSVGTLGYGYRSQPTFVVNYTGVNNVTLGFSNSNPWNSSIANFNSGFTSFNDGNAGSTFVGGSGYFVAPTVHWVAQGTSFTDNNATINNSGVITDISIPGFYSGNFSVLPSATVIPQESITATIDDVFVDSEGKITGFSVSNPGKGYNTVAGATPPAITFTSLISGFSPTAAVVTLEIDGNGSIDSYDILYQGAGYPQQDQANAPNSAQSFTWTIGSSTWDVQPNGVYVTDVYYGTGSHEYEAN